MGWRAGGLRGAGGEEQEEQEEGGRGGGGGRVGAGLPRWRSGWRGFRQALGAKTTVFLVDRALESQGL